MKRIAVLTAGLGMGTFHPAIYLKEELEAVGNKAELFLYEEYMESEKRENLLCYRAAFHQDMRLAIAGHKLMSKMNKISNLEDVASSLYEALDEGFDYVVVLSGNWVEPLCYLEQHFAFSLPIIFIYLDRQKAPSWQNKEAYPRNLEEIIWLIGSEQQPAKYYLLQKKSSKQKVSRLFLSGGGWGMGNYLDYAQPFSQYYPLDILLHSQKDTIYEGKGQAYYLFPENWKVWQARQNGRIDIPPLECCEIIDGNICLTGKKRHYDFYETNFCAASKPGGGSFIDSLAYGTPLVMLEPISKHEDINAKHYISEELAIDAHEWIRQDCSPDTVQRIENNLKQYIQTLQPLISIF